MHVHLHYYIITRNLIQLCGHPDVLLGYILSNVKEARNYGGYILTLWSSVVHPSSHTCRGCTNKPLLLLLINFMVCQRTGE